MEKLKEIWKEIVEKYKNQKTELLLMLVFIVAGVRLGIGEISQKAVSVSTAGAARQTEPVEEQEILKSEEVIKTQDEDNRGTDSSEDGDPVTEKDGSKESDADEEESVDGKAVADEEESAIGESAADEEESADGESAADEEESAGGEADADREGHPEENDAEGMTEEEDRLDEEEALEVMRRHDRRRRSALGRDFIIPMAVPEGYVRPEYDETEENIGITAGEDESEEAVEYIAGEDESEETVEYIAGGDESEEAVKYVIVDSESEEDTEILTEIADAEENTEIQTAFSPAEQITEADGDQEYLTVYTLQDTRELYEYEVLVDQDEADLFEEILLEAVLRRRLASYDGDWSVYIKNLKTDQTVLINDRPMKSASVMKLFILGTMYKTFESGEMERTDEIMSLMNDMIIYSSNEASNELLYRLGNSDYGRGIAKVNEFIQEYGFSDMTVEYNGFDDPATYMGTGNFNQVSAKDCGKLLEDIYHREWVSRSVSNEIEQMMLNQNTRYKIPAGLPEGVSCGNKTGEMDTTENDAAIIYAGSCDYILVVLSSDWNSKDEAISRIQSISSLVYQYLAE